MKIQVNEELSFKGESIYIAYGAVKELSSITLKSENCRI